MKKSKQTSEWFGIDTLTTVERIPQGSYTFEYYKQHKEKNGERGYAGAWHRGLDINADPMTVSVPEVVFIRQTAKNVEYTVKGRYDNCVDIFDLEQYSCKDSFNTQFGKFKNDNRGEFGGELITPTKQKVGGNFVYVFDWNTCVYAIDTLSHLLCRHFNLVKFTSANEYKYVYSAEDMSREDIENISEIGIDTLYLTDEHIYFVESGFYGKGTNNHWVAVKSVDKDDNIKTEFEILTDFYADNSWCLYDMSSLLVTEESIYIGGSKGLVRIDRVTKDYKYYTFLTADDIADITKATKLEERH